AFAIIGIPGSRFFHDAGSDAEIDKLARLGDSLAIHDVEFDLFEGRRHLVLDDLDAGLVADHVLALLDGADAADIETYRGIEFERIAAGRGFGRAEHDADLHADLVDEDDHAVRFGNGSRELAQSLAHQARLEAGQRIAYLALELGARRQRRDGIDDQDFDGAGSHQ